MTKSPVSSVLVAALGAVLPYSLCGASVPEPGTGAVPAGKYALDKAHASLVFRVDHLGFSHWTARFTRFDADLQFDPAKPAGSQVSVTIDPASITPDNPPPGFVATLQGAQLLDVGRYLQMTYRSTRVERVGQNGLRISGELTLHGVTRPLVLDAKYNGGYVGHPMDPHARIGFSAHGALKRSDFGIAFGIPQPGSTMGVGDVVEFVIEAEFSGPPWAGAANLPAPNAADTPAQKH
jgi:polyisoprenoid-binding protein YceI